ncbi:hypothetical protein NOF04DRAFT_1332694 [Fusarium oxysporum II5]|nr:hypothetical protein NOF04DRAFT_1332694 [Fusarium oxysporum II5]
MPLGTRKTRRTVYNSMSHPPRGEELGSSERRLRQAMASAAHQTNAVWRDFFREYSEEADKLSS